MARQLIARSELAAEVARHLVVYGPRYDAMAPALDHDRYQRALARLERSGVLRRWRWVVDGSTFTPYGVLGAPLWLAGPRWAAFVVEARDRGLLEDLL